MIHKTVIQYVPYGERVIKLSKKTVSQSLSLQLFCCVMISLFIAVCSFFCCTSIGNTVLGYTVYGDLFVDKMTNKQFDSLKKYIDNNSVTADNLNRLNSWCNKGKGIYLTIYNDNTLLYESTVAKIFKNEDLEYQKKLFQVIKNNTINSASQEFFYDSYVKDLLEYKKYDVFSEDPGKKYTLLLSDGTKTNVFLYYYPGDAYYYWNIFISGLISFSLFTIFFIGFVNKKLKYIKELKAELDVLSGGDWEHNIYIKGKDELGELAYGIDQMRISILNHQNVEEEMLSNNSKLVTAMSHDLRTPLTSLMGYLELLDRDKYENQEQLKHFIKKSLCQAVRIKSMADQLFEYFLVYSSEYEEPDLEPLDADMLFNQILTEYIFSLENQNFKVNTNLGVINGIVNVKIEMIQRIFDNIYSNILKYADKSKELNIKAFKENNYLIIIFSNIILQTRNKNESTNIGLNTCKRIMEYHKGLFEASEKNGVFESMLKFVII